MNSLALLSTLSGLALTPPEALPGNFDPAPIRCDQADTSQLSFDRLRQIVQSCHLTKIDDLIPLLPAEYRARYTLVYDSRSLQFASPEHPRVISFGWDAHLILAFTGSNDPGEMGSQSLETVEFNSTKRAFVYREISFDGGKPTVGSPNPTLCLGCHRQDPRPNWDGYFFWPGVFGAEDQGMFGKAAEDDPKGYPNEKALFQRYLSNRHSLRYQSLDDLKGYYESGANPDPHFPDGRIDYFMRGDHNLGFSQMVGGWNAQRIVRMITDEPKTKPYRYAILAAMSCSREDFPPEAQNLEDYVPDALKAHHPERLAAMQERFHALARQSFMDRLNRHFSLTGLTAPENSRVSDLWKATPSSPYGDTLEGGDRPFAASVQYILQATGVDLVDGSMEFGTSNYAFHIARGLIGGAEEFYWKAVLDPKADADLYALYSAAIQGGWDGFYLNWPDGATRAKLCQTLKAKSLAALQ